jgi:hypothetical protein
VAGGVFFLMAEESRGVWAEAVVERRQKQQNKINFFRIFIFNADNFKHTDEERHTDKA